MIRFLFFFAIAFVATLPAEEPGFVSIFNGKDLSGWTTREAMEGDWKVVEGVIDCDPQGEGKGDRNLWTLKEYGDFELFIDWRIKETPFTNPKARVILPDGGYQKNPSGELATIAAPNTDSGVFLRGQHKSQVNIWCWPIGSGEVWAIGPTPSSPPRFMQARRRRRRWTGPSANGTRFTS